MADTVALPNLFDDDNDFWPHPIYDKYEANREGIVRHVKRKKDIGGITTHGYLHISASGDGMRIRKEYPKHRFIYECFYGVIEDSMKVVDHMNNIKADNRLENLQLITRSENEKRANRIGKCLPQISVHAINLNNGESSDYDSLYKCSKDLDIHKSSISSVLNGITKTAISKKDKCKYTFEKLNCETNSHSIKVRATNINTGESSDYDSIYGCGRILDINHVSIRSVLKGTQKKAKSKKDKCKYTFKRI